MKGYILPILTPFNRDGGIDEQAMRTNLSYLIEEGIHGITISGSFGEFPLLSFEERVRLFEIAVDESAGRCPIIAGTAYASTDDTIRLCLAAEKTGVDALMIIAPYYLRPSSRDMRNHFELIDKKVSLPITIYNNPPRTAVNMSTELLVELSKLEHVTSIKQSTESFFDLLELIRLTKGEPNFHVTNGQEHWAFPGLIMGAQGCYGVTPLVLGKECIAMYDCSQTGDLERGREIQMRVNILRTAMKKCECTAAAAVREMVRLRGLAAGYSRAPIADPSDADKRILREAAAAMGMKPLTRAVQGAVA